MSFFFEHNTTSLSLSQHDSDQLILLSKSPACPQTMAEVSICLPSTQCLLLVTQALWNMTDVFDQVKVLMTTSEVSRHQQIGLWMKTQASKFSFFNLLAPLTWKKKEKEKKIRSLGFGTPDKIYWTLCDFLSTSPWQHTCFHWWTKSSIPSSFVTRTTSLTTETSPQFKTGSTAVLVRVKVLLVAVSLYFGHRSARRLHKHPHTRTHQKLTAVIQHWSIQSGPLWLVSLWAACWTPKNPPPGGKTAQT